MPESLLADRSFQLAVINLIDNALKYSASGRVVRVCASRDGEDVVVRVVDRGPGVPAEQLATLRERHVRHARDQAGYGLGLSIASSIVARHGGVLALSSPPPGRARGFEARIELALPGTGSLSKK